MCDPLCPGESVDLPSPLPPEDPRLSLRATGPPTVCLYQYDSNKRFRSAYKFLGPATRRRRPAQSADHKDVIMQLKGMACHPHKTGDQCGGGGADDTRERNPASLPCLKEEDAGCSNGARGQAVGSGRRYSSSVGSHLGCPSVGWLSRDVRRFCLHVRCRAFEIFLNNSPQLCKPQSPHHQNGYDDNASFSTRPRAEQTQRILMLEEF